jgi:hypothetical protein
MRCLISSSALISRQTMQSLFSHDTVTSYKTGSMRTSQEHIVFPLREPPIRLEAVTHLLIALASECDKCGGTGSPIVSLSRNSLRAQRHTHTSFQAQFQEKNSILIRFFGFNFMTEKTAQAEPRVSRRGRTCL